MCRSLHRGGLVVLVVLVFTCASLFRSAEIVSVQIVQGEGGVVERLFSCDPLAPIFFSVSPHDVGKIKLLFDRRHEGVRSGTVVVGRHARHSLHALTCLVAGGVRGDGSVHFPSLHSAHKHTARYGAMRCFPDSTACTNSLTFFCGPSPRLTRNCEQPAKHMQSTKMHHNRKPPPWLRACLRSASSSG